MVYEYIYDRTSDIYLKAIITYLFNYIIIADINMSYLCGVRKEM